MKNNLYVGLFVLIVTNCKSSNDNYFKLTITDQGNPVGLLPECIEVGSDGKLVILTNRFNEGKEIYQRTYFIELTTPQLDSIKTLMLYLSEIENIVNYDTTYNYKIKLDTIKNKDRISHIYIASPSDKKMSALIKYCKNLPEKNHRYPLKYSYYFNTDEICLEMNKN